MRYPGKFVRRVGLLSSLLIVGVLGGLLVPLSSEAGTPTLTLKVDGGAATSFVITASSTCTSTEVSLGYTHCYAINTNLTVNGANAVGGVQRSYNVRNAPGATARLRVGDNAGNDKFSLIGVQFVPAVTNWGTPAANTNEIHTLTITSGVTFDSGVNVNNKGTYVFALRAGGEFRAGPSQTTAPTACQGLTTTARCDTVGDRLTYPGTGTFNPSGPVNILRPSGANSQPLSLTVGGPTVAIVSFSGLSNTTLGQVNPTYPTFTCDLNGGALATGDVCKPRVDHTMTVTLKGPDLFVLVNGGDDFGANCTSTLSAKEQKKIAFLTKLVQFLNWLEQQHPNPHLSAFIDRIEAFLAVVNNNPDPNCPGATVVNLDIATAAAADQVAFAASGAAPVEPAPQTGTITITKNTGAETNDSFTFDISGPSSSTETIAMGNTNSESIVVMVDAGTYNITENPLAGWTLNSASCVGTGDGVSNGVVGVLVPAGGNVNCTFTNNFPPGTFNGHEYRVINLPGLTWNAARAAAQALDGGGAGWDLAAITSAGEQNVIQTLLPSLDGLTGIHDYWIAGEQPVESGEPGGNWRWVTDGVVFYNNGAIGYANWGTAPPGPVNEPNNLGNENHVTLDNRYLWGWNDLGGDQGTRGYVAERVIP